MRRVIFSTAALALGAAALGACTSGTFVGVGYLAEGETRTTADCHASGAGPLAATVTCSGAVLVGGGFIAPGETMAARCTAKPSAWGIVIAECVPLPTQTAPKQERGATPR